VFERKRSSSCQGQGKVRQESKWEGDFAGRGTDSVSWSARPHNYDNTEAIFARKSEDIRIQNLVKKQLQIRSKVLQQKDSKISFTTKGQPRPITDLIQKLTALILSDSSSSTPPQTNYTFSLNFSEQPSILSKARIRHKLKEDGTEQWFAGQVQSFARGAKEYTICYDGFDSLYSFSLALGHHCLNRSESYTRSI